MTSISDGSYLMNEMSCYLREDMLEINLPDLESNYQAHYYEYQLLKGRLQLLEVVLYLPNDSLSADIKTSSTAVINAIEIWRNTHLPSEIETNIASSLAAMTVLLLDIQYESSITNKNTINNSASQNTPVQRIGYDFADCDSIENIIPESNTDIQLLQIFGWHDWHANLEVLQTPCELWRFLNYRLEQIQKSIKQSSSNTKMLMASEFLSNADFFTPAITIDNALIKYGLQNEPNSALIAMSLAQKTNSPTLQMYQQHMQQAAALWSQLSMQMLDMAYKKSADLKQKECSNKSNEADLSQWEQQIVDESLFSRHELIRTLYKHPKQKLHLQEQGYVVHQHSYESLGRHYVLIFYGQDAKGQHSKAAIQPNLAKIALDVATRLPISELHHVIVLGINFIIENVDTFIDIDLWIQPVHPMSQRERQLTKHIHELQKERQSKYN